MHHFQRGFGLLRPEGRPGNGGGDSHLHPRHRAGAHVPPPLHRAGEHDHHRHGRRLRQRGGWRRLHRAGTLHPPSRPPSGADHLHLPGGRLPGHSLPHSPAPLFRARAAWQAALSRSHGHHRGAGHRRKGRLPGQAVDPGHLHRRRLRFLRHHLPCLEGVPELPICAGHAIAGRSPSHGLQLRRHRLHSRPRLCHGPAHLHDLLRRWRDGQLCAGPRDLVRGQPHGRRHGLSGHDSHFSHDGRRNLPQLCALHRRGRHRCRRPRRHPQIAARGGGIVRHRAARLPPRRGPAHGADRSRYSDHRHTPRRGGVGHRRRRLLWTAACHLDRGGAGPGADAALLPSSSPRWPPTPLPPRRTIQPRA